MVDDDDGLEGLPSCYADGLPRKEARCPSCGVLLTSTERGLDWPPDDDDDPDPLCERCKIP